MRTRKLDVTRSLSYHGRAMEFFHAMSDEAELERYNSAALLGIHASIALSDAIAIRESGQRAADEQHTAAVKLLANVARKRKASGDGSSRLSRILSKKSAIAYGDRYRHSDTEELKNIRLNVERLFAWAYEQFGHLGKEPA